MTIYLAAPWKRKPDARVARLAFMRANISVLAAWIDQHHDTQALNELCAHALKDLEQIELADAFVLLSLQLSEGKASELMWAYSHNKPIVVVGDPSSNVFNYLPGIRRVATVEEAIDALHS